MMISEQKAKERIAIWIYTWYQGGCAWVDLPKEVQERYRKDALKLLDEIEYPTD